MTAIDPSDRVGRLLDGASTDDYRKSMHYPMATSETFRPVDWLAHQWWDKPHRHVYDLAGEVDRLRAELLSTVAEHWKEVSACETLACDLGALLSKAIDERDAAETVVADLRAAISLHLEGKL